MAKKTFIESYKNNEIGISQIDDYVDAWHDGDSDLKLHEFLGLNAEQEEAWLTGGEDALAECIIARK